MNAAPVYPIYLRDFDNYFCQAASENDLNVVIEEKEVDEYTGWDSTGLPVHLSFEEDRIIASVSGEVPQLDQLRRALVDFAETYGDGASIEGDWENIDVSGLYAWAESQVVQYEQSRSLGARLKRLFKRS